MNRSISLVAPVLVGAALITGSALADTLTVPGEFPTIQAAIDAAVDGDEVVVADGTYTGDGNRDMDFGGKAITVRSENGADACTIDIGADDEARHRGFHFHSGETAESVVEGFTFENGFSDRGGAVLCELKSAPSFRACVFRDNNASTDSDDDGGGAAYMLGSSPTFTDCDFVRNQVETHHLFAGGGAVRIQSGSSPTFVRCRFSDNSADGPEESDAGAALVSDGGHPVFSSCTFTGNRAHWDGAIGSLSGVTMERCRFENNGTLGEAGGAFGQYGGQYGAGHSVFVDCVFIGNFTASNAGGGIVLQLVGVTAEITNCVFIDNRAASSGGGLWLGDGAEADVSNCTFIENSGNTGGGLSVVRDAACNVANSIFWSNTPNQIAVQAEAPVTVTYSDVEGGWDGEGNIDDDPLLDERGCLAPGSPAIDAGDNAAVPEGITDDINGRARFVDGNGDATMTVDMGACEYQTCPSDVDRDGAVGFGDLLAVLAAWGPYTPCPPGIAEDIDLDCEVGFADLLAVLAAWGECP